MKRKIIDYKTTSKRICIERSREQSMTTFRNSKVNSENKNVQEHYFSLKELIQQGKDNIKLKDQNKSLYWLYSMPAKKLKRHRTTFVRCELFQWARQLANVPENCTTKMKVEGEQKELEKTMQTVTTIVNSSRRLHLERDMTKIAERQERWLRKYQFTFEFEDVKSDIKNEPSDENDSIETFRNSIEFEDVKPVIKQELFAKNESANVNPDFKVEATKIKTELEIKEEPSDSSDMIETSHLNVANIVESCETARVKLSFSHKCIYEKFREIYGSVRVSRTMPRKDFATYLMKTVLLLYNRNETELNENESKVLHEKCLKLGNSMLAKINNRRNLRNGPVFWNKKFEMVL